MAKQTGVTLMELLISLALGASALVAVASLIGYGIGTNANLIASARLNEEVSSVLSLMQRDIRRAGYSGATVATVADPAGSPSAFSDSLQVSEFTGEAADSCVLFSYDADGDGVLDGGVNGDSFGYRLNNQQIEMRQNGSDCEATDWLDLTDSGVINVTGLNFALTETVESNVTTTTMTITLQAELVAKDQISRQYTHSFLVRNFDG
ncbi:prepilin cleavage protein [Alteromonas aestuariivivens]|uniref:Prepilin cleavage protein n=1 Tax=Alteromonas aestuariivivens TaxID=1938339 RepID=A0A3D8MFD6_9ALTE|nr:prepilin-type N-terminal cleavage/methylation domain-containing protein [Alteromonas aestuariivivens]RDV29320.1 prepilin cleavage protein [Alteromonas aestuariivivens]